MVKSHQENSRRSRSFAVIVEFCAGHPLISRCGNQHSMEDAKLYDISDPIFLQRIIRSGANINTKHCLTAESPLHCAIITQKDIKVVNEFIKLGADVNSADVKGYTPLHSAVVNKNIDAIEALIHHGANINQPSLNCWSCPYYLVIGYPSDGSSPLDIATRDLSVAKFVIMHTLLKNSDKDPSTVINLRPYELQAGYRELSSYLLKCQGEITKMKSVKLNKSLSLCDFVKDAIRNRTLAVNCTTDFDVSDIIQALCEHQYEVFKNIIIEGIERKSLIRELSQQYDYLPFSAKDKNRDVSLDVYSVYSIVDYLSKEEIVNFLIALYFVDKDIKPNVSFERDESLSTKKNAFTDKHTFSPSPRKSPSIKNDILSTFTRKRSLSSSTEKDNLSPPAKKHTLNPSIMNTLLLSTREDIYSKLTKMNNCPPAKKHTLNPSIMNTLLLSTREDIYSKLTKMNNCRHLIIKDNFRSQLKNDNCMTMFKKSTLNTSFQNNTSSPLSQKGTSNPLKTKMQTSNFLKTKKKSSSPLETKKNTSSLLTKNDTFSLVAKMQTSNPLKTKKNTSSLLTKKDTSSSVANKNTPSPLTTEKYTSSSLTKLDASSSSTKMKISSSLHKKVALSSLIKENSTSPSSTKNDTLCLLPKKDPSHPSTKNNTLYQLCKKRTSCSSTKDLQTEASVERPSARNEQRSEGKAKRRKFAHP